MITVLVDDNLGGGALLFERPHAFVRANQPDELAAALSQLDEAQAGGAHAAGFLSFELGYALEPKLSPLLPSKRTLPLLLFGLYGEPTRLAGDAVEAWLRTRGDGHRVSEVTPDTSFEGYRQKFARVLEMIGAGDIYQLNLTFKARFNFEGSAASLFAELRKKQRVATGAFIETEDFSLLSLSPELFLDWAGDDITTRPMKGTAPRGLTLEADQKLWRALSSSEKARAENLMIVDLMRNDLARVAAPGTVRVTDLFTVEPFETLLQMTSGVSARMPKHATFSQALFALFPPGSVTGAPKIRAIELIRELEGEARGAYTGAIGYLRPRRGCFFNVAIRTLVVNANGKGEIGIGSGVVQDSEARAEYEECLLKMRFLTDPPEPCFELIETLRYSSREGYVLFDRHLARLERSAARFGFAFDPSRIARALEQFAATLSEGEHRVRALLSRSGEISISSAPLAPMTGFSFAIAPEPVHSANLFLYHKTTNREFYDQTRAALAAATGCGEALFLNERGELTEGSFTNLFVEIGGKMLTPALRCGLLPGTLREELIAKGEAEEAILTLEDLARADRIWLGNSVRGLVPAKAVHIKDA